jgi:hypothetical protein
MEQRSAAEVIVAVKPVADDGMGTCPRTKPTESADEGGGEGPNKLTRKEL